MKQGKVYWSKRQPLRDDDNKLDEAGGSLSIQVPVLLYLPTLNLGFIGDPYVMLNYTSLILERLEPHVQKIYKPDSGEIFVTNVNILKENKMVVKDVIDGSLIGIILNLKFDICRILSKQSVVSKLKNP